MNKKISSVEIDDLNTEQLVREHSQKRPELPGLSAAPVPRTVSSVLNEVETENAYLEKVPASAWKPLDSYAANLIDLASTTNLIIHVDTDEWTVLLHERHTTHPQPKLLRSDPPVQIEYLSLFEAWNRIRDWRKRGFTCDYQPSAERFGNRAVSQRLVFNIGFRYIRLYWTPKGYVWADNFNTAIPHNVLHNTIYFPTLKERASGNKRHATQLQMHNSFSARFQGEIVPTQLVEVPVLENEAVLAAKAELYHGQDLHSQSEADICSKADAADVLGPVSKRPTRNYLICTNNKTEGVGVVRAAYSSRVAASRNLKLASDLIHTRPEYLKIYGKPATDPAVEPAGYHLPR